MQKTANYNLNKPEATDPLRVEDFNENAEKIDAALSGLNTAVGNKADASALAALSAAIGSGGSNCRIAWGTYTGKNTCGASNPTVLTFAFRPLLVVMGSDYFAEYEGNPSVLVRGRTLAQPDTGANSNTANLMNVTWTDNGVSFYHASNPGYQNNGAFPYYWVALGVTL